MSGRIRTLLAAVLDAIGAWANRRAQDYRGETASEDRVDSVGRQLLVHRLQHSGITPTEQELRELVRLARSYDTELHEASPRPPRIAREYERRDGEP